MIDNSLVAKHLFALAEAYREEGSAAPDDEKDMYYSDADDYETAGVMLKDCTYNLLGEFMWHIDTVVRENIQDFMKDWMDDAEFRVAMKVINKVIESKLAA